MRAENACAPLDGKVDWNQIDWKTVNRTVRRLQVRIVKAAQAGRWGKVRALQRLLTHSYSGRCLAVRRVTENRGKKTAGVDGKTWDTPAQKGQAVAGLRQRGYRPRPLRRVYIPKHSDPRQKRPLGIPTMQDRAMQALYLLALDPLAETSADPNSYGFRQARATADAIAQCFIIFRGRRGAAEWVLEGDIKACFDRIDHDWLLAHVPLEQRILSQWLKAGYLEQGAFHPTEAGTPQGGIISPVLANLALDGLEEELRQRFRPRDNSKPSSGVNYVRYADDFIVSARTRELLEDQVRPFIAAFLEERGLELSTVKTRITHIDEGFDFLGQNVRRYNGKLIIQPSKKSRKTFLDRVRAIIKANRTATAGQLIVRLNPVIRGWANYHRHVCSKASYRYCDYAIFRALWRWARRRHPHKGARWVRRKYFKTVGRRTWTFSGEVVGRNGQPKAAHLLYAARTSIRRHVKIRAAAHPYDPAWELYFEQRLQAQMRYSLKQSPRLLRLWLAQDGQCPHCDQAITLTSHWHVHHKVWRVLGGGEHLNNLEMLHPTCHWQKHSRRLSAQPPRPDQGV
jgi:RNA-directed DNA polymerase